MIFFLMLLIILLFYIVIEEILQHKIITPIFIINGIFAVWLILGRLGYLGQFKPSYDSSIFIEINIIILDLFIILGETMTKRNFSIKINYSNFDFFIKFFRYFSFFVSVMIFINLLLNIYLGTIKIENVRNISYSVAFGTDEYTKIYFNSIIYYIYQFLIRGFAFFDLTYSIGSMIYDKESNISKISLANFVLFIIIMQSRIEFMKLIVFLLIFLGYTNIKFEKSLKKKLKRVGIIIGIAIFITLSIRTVSSQKNVILHAFDSFIVDFSGSNYTFSTYYDEFQQGLKIADPSPIIFKYLGGIGLVIEYILGIFWKGFDHSLVNAYLGKAHYIGSSDHYNAFYTIYFEFLNSGGIIGCVLFSAIAGYIVGRRFKEQSLNNTLKNTYISAFVTYVMAVGTYNYVLSGIYAFMILICLIIAPDKTQKKEIKDGKKAY